MLLKRSARLHRDRKPMPKRRWRADGGRAHPDSTDGADSLRAGLNPAPTVKICRLRRPRYAAISACEVLVRPRGRPWTCGFSDWNNWASPHSGQPL